MTLQDFFIKSMWFDDFCATQKFFVGRAQSNETIITWSHTVSQIVRRLCAWFGVLHSFICTNKAIDQIENCSIQITCYVVHIQHSKEHTHNLHSVRTERLDVTGCSCFLCTRILHAATCRQKCWMDFFLCRRLFFIIFYLSTTRNTVCFAYMRLFAIGEFSL